MYDLSDYVLLYHCSNEKRMYMKKVSVKVNSKAEKTIIVTTLSAMLAIIFDQKKKKPEKRKNFIQRIKKHYKRIDKIISSTVAKDVAKNEALAAEKL